MKINKTQYHKSLQAALIMPTKFRSNSACCNKETIKNSLLFNIEADWMLVSLKRFQFNKGKISKLKKNFICEEEIIVNDKRFALKGIIFHHGHQIHTGYILLMFKLNHVAFRHYTCNLKLDGEWIHFDNDKATKKKEKNQNFKDQSIYILLYKKEFEIVDQ